MKKAKAHKFTLYKKWVISRLRKEWRWRIKADNGNIIAASSESYVNKSDAEYNAKSTASSIIEHYTNL